MYGVSISTPRRAGWSLALALLVLATVGCDVHVGWSAEYNESLSGRTPGIFAAACDDISGTLLDAENGGDRAKSSCTMPNGDAITCDWQGQRCTTVCESSEQECAKVRDLAYVPILRRKVDSATPKSTDLNPDSSTPSAHGAPPTDAVANTGL